jgi:hypothetical protein
VRPLPTPTFAFALLVHGQFVADDAARRRAGEGVVVSEMAGDAADHRAAHAARLRLAGQEHGPDRTQQNLRFHDESSLELNALIFLFASSAQNYKPAQVERERRKRKIRFAAGLGRPGPVRSSGRRL